MQERVESRLYMGTTQSHTSMATDTGCSSIWSGAPGVLGRSGQHLTKGRTWYDVAMPCSVTPAHVAFRVHIGYARNDLWRFDAMSERCPWLVTHPLSLPRGHWVQPSASC